MGLPWSCWCSHAAEDQACGARKRSGAAKGPGSQVATAPGAAPAPAPPDGQMGHRSDASVRAGLLSLAERRRVQRRMSAAEDKTPGVVWC